MAALGAHLREGAAYPERNWVGIRQRRQLCGDSAAESQGTPDVCNGKYIHKEKTMEIKAGGRSQEGC